MNTPQSENMHHQDNQQNMENVNKTEGNQESGQLDHSQGENKNANHESLEMQEQPAPVKNHDNAFVQVKQDGSSAYPDDKSTLEPPGQR